jgi:predicted N-acetyltransferase YhbS
VHLAAFGQREEAALVDALRAGPSFLPELSLVAADGEDVLGHVLLSEASLDTGHAVLALAPIGVRPERQGQGVGARLMEEAVRRARETTYPLVVLVGHPRWYPRFGFESASRQGVRAPWDVPDEAWMMLPLPAHAPEVTGAVVYPPPFNAL